jgi:hypothetical protein
MSSTALYPLLVLQNFSGSRSCAHSHKMSVEQLDQLQRAARYRLRTDPCKVTGYIIPPLRRVNTDRAATIIFAKTTSRRVKRRVKQAVVDEQSQPNKDEEDDLGSGSDDEHPVKTSRTLATNSQQQEGKFLLFYLFNSRTLFKIIATVN